MDPGYSDVNVSSSVAANVLYWREMLIMGEVMHVWRQDVYEKFLYLPFNFAVNLKLLFYKNYFLKKVVVLHIVYLTHLESCLIFIWLIFKL